MKPWPHLGTLLICHRCGHVQKDIGPEWARQTDSIYADYELNLLADGAEQLKGEGVTRSDRLLARLRSRVDLPDAGSLLDIGCGNGATLRAFGRALPRLAGFEIDAKTREEVLAIPGVKRFFDGDLQRVNEKFDCITLIHVLEHRQSQRRSSNGYGTIWLLAGSCSFKSRTPPRIHSN